MFGFYLLLAFIGVIVAAFSQVLLKKGAMRPHISFIRDYLNAPVICGYGLMFVALLASNLSYRGVNYMAIQVIEAVGYILVPILSCVFFKEKLTKNKIIGIIIILAGVLIFNI
ncbi:MAG: multidrug ABC transporter [Lachnospiraceae bacterium]|nr:multidrug ABC transporter [Lachnospiraceae bacterium]